LTETGFLELPTEIDYFTGLYRDRKEFLIAAEDIIDKMRLSLDLSVDMKLFNRVGTGGSILEVGTREEMLNKLFGKKPTVEEQEELLDRIENGPRETQPDDNGERRSIVQYEEPAEQAIPFIRYFETLKLASMILRNSELVDDAALKHSIYSKLLLLWSEILLSILLTVEDAEGLREKKIQELFPMMSPTAAKYMAKLALPNVIFLTLLENLGTNKLEVVISDHAARQTDALSKLLSTFLYVDLGLPNYLNKLDELLSAFESNRYMLELILLKLLNLFMFRNLSDAETRRVEVLAGKVFVLLNDRGSKMQNDAMKSKFITDLKRRELNPSK